MAKAKKTAKKSASGPSPLREVVGDEVYAVWMQMLKELVPDGRTHRLSVVVASMLIYASQVLNAGRKRVAEGSPGYPLLVASEHMEDEALDLLRPMLVRLFKDAGVKYERVSSKGERYSILWETVFEFCRWYNYPWE